MTTFVLVHDAFHGGWAWRHVRPLLRGPGHDVWTPSLTGTGDRSHLADRDIDLAVWVDDIANLLRYHDLSDVVLVGHGYGGVVAAAVSQYAARRLTALVLLDTPLPENGRSLRDLVPADVRARGGDRGGPATWRNPPPPGPAPGGGARGRGPAEGVVAWAAARMTPSPARPEFERLRVDEPAALAVPRHHLFCARTPASYPATFTRLRLEADDEPYELLDADHDAPLTAPALVAEHLLRAADGDHGGPRP